MKKEALKVSDLKKQRIKQAKAEKSLISACSSTMFDYETFQRALKNCVDTEANLDVKDSFKCGMRPLHHLVEKEETKAIEDLLKAGANPNKKDDEKETPLHLACSYNRVEIASKLLEHGANVNSKSEYGNTPLHNACLVGNTELIEKLLDNGAKRTMTNDMGYDYLHQTCYAGKIDAVRLLVKKGLDPSNKDFSGKTGLDIAKSKGNMAVVRYLENIERQKGKRLKINRANNKLTKGLVKDILLKQKQEK
jgi:ankyrin repeat protein